MPTPNLKFVIGNTPADCHLFLDEKEIEGIVRLELNSVITPDESVAVNIFLTVLKGSMELEAQAIPCNLTISEADE